jgi:osmotically-inducible protein OsmY
MYKKLISSLICISALISCVPAVTGLVGSVGVGTAKRHDLKQTISDTKISTVIKVRFLDKGFNDLYKKIGVQVMFNRVFLFGYVASQEDMDKAVEIVLDTEGVVDVINEIKISDKSNYFNTKQYLVDTYITSAVKARLFGKKDIRSFNYTVITQDSVVYLFGMVHSQEEVEKASSTASYVSGVEKVKSFILIK